MDLARLQSLIMQREYVSGEWISGQMGVTRAAVWKGVEALRARGVPIESAKRLGYHIEPPAGAVWPLCIRRHLDTRWAGGEIEYYPQIDSTNARARALGRADGLHGTLIIAEEQSHGRGRMARGWSARPGDAALMSLLLRPEALHPSDAPTLVMVAAVALAEACRDIGAEASIKWPNDLVLGGKKLSGTLLEMGADMDRVNYAVVGMGVNINGHPALSEDTATSLAAHLGRPINRAEWIARALKRFEGCYEAWAQQGVDAVLPAYRALSATLGRPVRVTRGDVSLEGTATDIQRDGALLFTSNDGLVTTLREGDVSVRGIMGYV